MLIVTIPLLAIVPKDTVTENLASVKLVGRQLFIMLIGSYFFTTVDISCIN